MCGKDPPWGRGEQLLGQKGRRSAATSPARASEQAELGEIGSLDLTCVRCSVIRTRPRAQFLLEPRPSS
jgi:hypothetical protein